METAQAYKRQAVAFKLHNSNCFESAGVVAIHATVAVDLTMTIYTEASPLST